MPDTAVSGLGAVTGAAILDTDLVEISRPGSPGSNLKLTAAELRAFIRDAISMRRRLWIRNEGYGATATDEHIWSVSGTGAANSQNAVADPGGHPGVMQSQTGTTTTGRAGLQGNVGTNVLLGNGAVRYDCAVRIPTLSDGTETFNVRAGLLDSVSAESVDGCHFRYTHGENGGNWTLVTRSNSVETAANSNVAVVANTWYRLTVEVNAAGTSVTFYVNGTACGTITTNIPTAAGRQTGWGHGIIKSAGTTSRSLDVDYWEVEQLFTTPR